MLRTMTLATVFSLFAAAPALLSSASAAEGLRESNAANLPLPAFKLKSPHGDTSSFNLQRMVVVVFYFHDAPGPELTEFVSSLWDTVGKEKGIAVLPVFLEGPLSAHPAVAPENIGSAVVFTPVLFTTAAYPGYSQKHGGYLLPQLRIYGRDGKVRNEFLLSVFSPDDTPSYITRLIREAADDGSPDSEAIKRHVLDKRPIRELDQVLQLEKDAHRLVVSGEVDELDRIAGRLRRKPGA
ncbi:MAG: hypothetical protein HYV15_02535, partial [Elusimicrobia bacterium]|nr:hypothetical protein [Elusimicrobiota bacterium]